MKNTSHYNKEHKQFSRELRNNSTLGEIILWKRVLRAKKMHGFQFLRQFSIDDYIVDFICRKLKLIIEIDGYSHNFKYSEDIRRDIKLNNLGYKVIRFSEKRIRYDLDNVAAEIENIVLESINNQSP